MLQCGPDVYVCDVGSPRLTWINGCYRSLLFCCFSFRCCYGSLVFACVCGEVSLWSNDVTCHFASCKTRTFPVHKEDLSFVVFIVAIITL